MASCMQLDQYGTILRFKRPIMSSDTVKLDYKTIFLGPAKNDYCNSEN